MNEHHQGFKDAGDVQKAIHYLIQTALDEHIINIEETNLLLDMEKKALLNVLAQPFIGLVEK